MIMHGEDPEIAMATRTISMQRADFDEFTVLCTLLLISFSFALHSFMPGFFWRELSGSCMADVVFSFSVLFCFLGFTILLGISFR